MVNGLTKKQLEIFEFIKTFIAQHQFSPSYREIQKEFGLSSSSTISQHIHTLIKKGFLQKGVKQARSILTVKHISQELSLPLTAHLHANKPIEYLSNDQKIAVPSYLVPNPQLSYVMKVIDNGFTDELLHDQDLLLVEKKETIFDGETVIISINNCETFILRYYDQGDHICLKSLNSNYRPLILRREKIQIEGVVLLLLRLY